MEFISLIHRILSLQHFVILFGFGEERLKAETSFTLSRCDLII